MDGYKVKINKIEECEKGKNVFKLDKPNALLSKDCFASADGCIDLTKDFESCKVVYDVKKRGMMVPFKGEKDVCEEIAKASQDPEAQKKLKEKNINPNCPIKKMKLCAPPDEKVDVTKYKDKFRLAAGQYSGTITLVCDCGKSCYKFDVEFKRGK
ncbi:hypothetical protein ANN_09666 [Periplaneta americana]|uniref:Uncharacterized protein n=1 Tax=Periplaneta americana TaxID=6978 RepID=A0ABQ8TMA0_PERAM|nr:hypothetical protein ANN_09666 [Periplaneta americana]